MGSYKNSQFLVMCLFIFTTFQIQAQVTCDGVLLPEAYMRSSQSRYDIPTVIIRDGNIDKWYMRTSRGFNELTQDYFSRNISRLSEVLPQKYLDPTKWTGMDVIDTGCGGGSFVEDLRSLGVNAVGVDIFLETHQKNKSYFHQADLRKTGFPDNSFDVLINSYNIFHYSETPEFYRESIREFIRVLKPGGVIFVLGAKKGILNFFEFRDQIRIIKQPGDVTPLRDDSDIIVQKY